MKKIIFSTVLIITAVIASAQSKVRLNFYSHYVFDDGFEEFIDANTYYNGKVKGGYEWGGSIEFAMNPNFSLELMYLNKNSDAPTDFKLGPATNVITENFEVSHNYILMAFNRLQPLSTGKVEGYGGFIAGILISDVKAPSNGGSDSNTNFAWGGRIGSTIWVSEKFGIKLQAQILSASRATGGDLYFSYYGPVVLETYSTLWQFGLGGGLTFKLGN